MKKEPFPLLPFTIFFGITGLIFVAIWLLIGIKAWFLYVGPAVSLVIFIIGEIHSRRSKELTFWNAAFPGFIFMIAGPIAWIASVVTGLVKQIRKKFLERKSRSVI